MTRKHFIKPQFSKVFCDCQDRVRNCEPTVHGIRKEVSLPTGKELPRLNKTLYENLIIVMPKK